MAHSICKKCTFIKLHFYNKHVKGAKVLSLTLRVPVEH